MMRVKWSWRSDFIRTLIEHDAKREAFMGPVLRVTIPILPCFFYRGQSLGLADGLFSGVWSLILWRCNHS